MYNILVEEIKVTTSLFKRKKELKENKNLASIKDLN